MASSAMREIAAAGRLDSDYLESMFQSAGLAIIACDANGQVAAYNAAAARLFGVPGTRSVGQSVSALFPPADRLRIEEAIQQCVSTVEPVDFRFRLGDSVESFEYGCWCMPVLEPDGSVRGVSLWFRDITQRVRLKKALEKQQRLASLGTLSGAVAHHYNNMLGCITTSVDLALKTNSNTAMRKALHNTADTVARASKMTRQLLAFAQADHRDTDQSDLTEVVLYYFDENEPRLARHNIKLTLDWQQIPVLPVPREPLMLVVGNLVDNAIEAMPQGGTLHVNLARRDEDSVMLSINDTGPGIRDEDMEHLFEPFYSTKNELTCGKAHNAGLGLAVVHGIVSDLHGTITAANVPGRGARFDVVLPLTAPA